tara:strand:- start:1519 stop:2616 length:1098 start_codon:yes stop_codon:yes gene_type:complete
MADIQQYIKDSRVKTTKQNDLVTLIQNRVTQFADVLPPGSNAKKFVTQALMAIERSPKLQQCEAKSIIKALYECASYGLEPNGSLSEADLVPYGKRVEFLIGYRGLMKLASNTGMVRMFDFGVIHENDEVDYRVGNDSFFSHKPKLSGRGVPIAYYALAQLTTDATVVQVMTTEEIYAHGQRHSPSFSHNTSPWQTDFQAMAIKTCMRQLCDKKLPKDASSESKLLQSAAHRDDFQNLNGNGPNMEVPLDVSDFDIADPKKTPEKAPKKQEKQKKVPKVAKEKEVEKEEPTPVKKDTSDFASHLQKEVDEIVKLGGNVDDILTKIVGTKKITKFYNKLPDDVQGEVLDEVLEAKDKYLLAEKANS